jgi:nucleotidyltransferase substrate binding protein (TIGR01987 family)
MAIQLDIEPLKKAILSLKAGMAESARQPDNDVVRDGCIQRFEFTYEVSHKMLRRFLEATSADPVGIDALSFQDLIRTGSERGLLKSDWSSWREFRRARSITSPIYDEAKAREVFAAIPEFIDEADHLHERLAAEIAR